MDQMRREMPLGYTLERQSRSYGQEERRLYGLLGLVMALIFFICAVTFERLRQALAVLLVSGLTVNGLIPFMIYGQQEVIGELEQLDPLRVKTEDHSKKKFLFKSIGG